MTQQPGTSSQDPFAEFHQWQQQTGEVDFPPGPDGTPPHHPQCQCYNCETDDTPVYIGGASARDDRIADRNEE